MGIKCAGSCSVKSARSHIRNSKEPVAAGLATREIGDNVQNLNTIDIFLVNSLKACAKRKDLYEGSRIHADIRDRGLLEKNPYLGNTLVSMYAKCGALVRAQQVLDELPVRDVVSWSALIAGYTQHGCGKEALDCFHRMQREGLYPNAITHTCILKACGITHDLEMGKKIHDEIADQGLLESDTVLGSALVDMYAKCGALAKAQQVLDELPAQNIVSWSALIAGYTQHGHGKEALHCFNRMQKEGLFPNAITYACTLKACGITQDLEMGKRIHDEIVSQGLLRKDIVLGSSLVDMYAKCGAFVRAKQVLNQLPLRNVASWSGLIAGFTQRGHGKEALDCFYQMRKDGIFPDEITYVCMLKACGITQDVDLGKKIHDEILDQGLLKKNILIGTALVDMYANCATFTKAQEVLNELPVRDVSSWNALIAGYARHGQGLQAHACFHRMRREGLDPDSISYASMLKVCGITQDIELGKKIHDDIHTHHLLEKNVVLGTALVDMYAKCGILIKAEKVLEELPVPSVDSWNALIAGYCQQGRSRKALNCFQRMQIKGIAPNIISWNSIIGGYAQRGLAMEALNCFRQMRNGGICPDGITFVSILNACSHTGLVNEGQMYFDDMREIYGITPDKEHYTCMVDLFGRVGLFDKAMTIIKQMPLSDYRSVWCALLGACQKWGNWKLGIFAFKRAIQLDRCNAAAYLAMTNIYAAAGMHEEAKAIDKMRIENTALKQSQTLGCQFDAR